MVRIREINGLPVVETQDLKNNVGEIPSGVVHQKTGDRILLHALPMTSCVYKDGNFWMPCLNTILYVQDKPVERWEGFEVKKEVEEPKPEFTKKWSYGGSTATPYEILKDIREKMANRMTQQVHDEFIYDYRSYQKRVDELKKNIQSFFGGIDPFTEGV